MHGQEIEWSGLTLLTRLDFEFATLRTTLSYYRRMNISNISPEFCD
jgi:hypothetical protein